MRLNKRINHDKALGLFVVAATMSTGYFFTFLRYATIDCAGFNVPNGGACAVDVIASVFLAVLSATGFVGVYYFGPFVVNNKREENGTENEYVNLAKHYVNLTHLAPKPLDYFDYGFHANASYHEALHQDLNINGKRVMSKVWGNSSVGSYEFHLGELPVSASTSMSSKVIRSLTGRSYNCEGYVRIDKYYAYIDPETPAHDWNHAQTLALDLVTYLLDHDKDGGCFYATGDAGGKALIGFRAGCNAVNVPIPSCPYNPTGLTSIGYTSLSKREPAIEERSSIGWVALCADSGDKGQVCQCWQEHGITPYSACQKEACNYCDQNPLADYCLSNFSLDC